ncbi:MAG: cellulase family glycosylhydrolase [Oscillospiraceae bacterium]|jgi:endoglycosylceramidase|nr:cellulase family glycosylhydrolase [Oscillospiraceae bacterium]
MNKITTSGNSFMDEAGRERIFNGINVCDKGSFNGKGRDFVHAWEPERFVRFQQAGMNVIRLGVTWEAIEPLPGLYNEAYLDALTGILDGCAEYGIYAYIDMHQDLYAGFGDGPGDGAPEWACLTGKHHYKKPRFIWGESYLLSKAVHTAFDNFWNNQTINGKGLQDYYRNMWRHVTARLKDHPALLGFDLMNEPFIGSESKKAFKTVICAAIKTTLFDKRIPRKQLLKRALKKDERIHALDFYTPDIIKTIVSGAFPVVKKFEEGLYTRFLTGTAESVREVTPDGIFFLEHCVFANAGIPSAVRPITPGGKREQNQAFAPHAYDLMVDTPYYKYANNERVAAIFAQRKAEQDSTMDMPVLVGEWGGNSEGTEWLPHVEFLLSLFDRYQWSHTYWCYYDGILDSPLMGVLRRPYPRAVTGNILSYAHDRDENTFTLTYRQEKTYDVHTEIYAHLPVESVETDGEYTLTPLNETTSIINVATGEGLHTVTVRFAGGGFSYRSAGKQ